MDEVEVDVEVDEVAKLKKKKIRKNKLVSREIKRETPDASLFWVRLIITS